MRCLFLSTIIGILCAVSVAVVAALTLSVALPLALRTIDANSEAAVLVLGRTAATALDHVLRVPADSVAEAGGRMVSMGGRVGLPTEDPAYNWTTGWPAVPQLRQTIHTMARMGRFSYYVTGVTTSDGILGVGFSSQYYEIMCFQPSPLGPTAQPRFTMSIHDKPSGAFNATVTALFTGPAEGAGGESDAAENTGPEGAIGTYADAGYRAAWAKWRAGSHPDGAAVWGPPMIFADTDAVTVAHSVSTLIRNTTHDLGIAFVLFDIAGTAKLLNTARLSSGSQVFLYDKDLYLVSASAGLRTYTSENFTGHDDANGCTTTQASERLYRSQLKLRVCRFHLSRSPHSALTEAYGALPSVFARPATGGEIHQVKGRFVFVQPLAAVRYGYTMSLVVLTPRADFLGDAGKILPATLGVAALAVVVAATAAFVLVRVVLSPLQGIAARMGRAARLEEDDEGEAVSALAEVGDLQRSFFLLKNELARIRAFVPQSLLRAQSGDEDDDAWTEADLREALSSGKESYSPSTAHGSVALTSSVLKSGSHHVPPSSTGSESQYTFSARPRVAKAALNLGTGVRQESVTVLVLNLRGFHRATAAGVAAEAVAGLVATVLEAVQQEKGVVDAFNGDRFLVSFNAARMAAGHSIRAARVACRVAAALSAEAPVGRDGQPGEGYRLPVTAGVATGPAQVGNLGSSAMKRFSIIGPVVSQAAVLERMCKLYDGVRCLVPQRLFEDLHTAVRLETVDYVRLPGARGSRGTLVAGVTAELGGATDDEWMYQLEQQGACGGKRQSACTTTNAAWVDLVAGRVDEAAAKVPAVPPPQHRMSVTSATESDEPRQPASALGGEWVGPRTLRDQFTSALAAAQARVAAGLAPALLPTALGPFYAAATDTW